jgi:protein-disulfide isomerase
MAVSPIVKKIMQDYDGKLRLVIKDVPNENQQASVNAALAALAAGDQGKYWEMHELLFDRWPEFDRESLVRNARDLGLDIEQFKQSMNDKKHADTLKRNLNLAEELNVHSTPMFVINGKKYDGELTYKEFKKIIEEELRKAKTQ